MFSSSDERQVDRAADSGELIIRSNRGRVVNAAGRADHHYGNLDAKMERRSGFSSRVALNPESGWRNPSARSIE
jgi:hypothetical protein